MYYQPVGTLLTIEYSNGDRELAEIVAGDDYFSFVIKREDDHTQRLHASNIAHFYYDVPCIIVPFSAIDTPLSYSSQLPIEYLEGNWFLHCYYMTSEREVTTYWKRYREQFPIDPYGVLWNYTEATSGFLTPEEIERYNYASARCADCQTTVDVGYSNYYKLPLCLSCAESRGV